MGDKGNIEEISKTPILLNLHWKEVDKLKMYFIFKIFKYFLDLTTEKAINSNNPLPPNCGLYIHEKDT